jgi:hypothetical protein
MRFKSQQDQEIFLFSKTSGLGLHPTSLLFNMYWKLFSPEAKWLGINLTAHLHLAPKFKIAGAILPLTLNAFMAWPENCFHFTFLLKEECV